MSMLKLEHVEVVFNAGTPDENAALKDINLTVEKGDFITIIGSNGAGKSTLFNVIAGSLCVTGGKIFLGGRDVTKDAEYKRAKYIGRIFQNPLLGTAGKMSLADNMMICSKKGWKGLKISLNKNTRRRFTQMLAGLNMNFENRLNENVSRFSGGQRQALTLLMSVMSKPEILLLDEHTAALDPANAEAVMKLTKKFAVENNLTVMMITHNMRQALDYGNRLLMMDAGEIIMDIKGAEKENLTLDDIALRFKKIKNKSLANDEMILQ